MYFITKLTRCKEVVNPAIEGEEVAHSCNAAVGRETSVLQWRIAADERGVERVGSSRGQLADGDDRLRLQSRNALNIGLVGHRHGVRVT